MRLHSMRVSKIYITHFSKLMAVLKRYLSNPHHTDERTMLYVIQSFDYVMKFIVKSKLLSSE